MNDKISFPAIILFDGFCNLCNRSIDFVIKRDKKKIFRYVALQSEAGIFLRDKYEIPAETDSVILWQSGKFFFQSEAALRIAVQLRFPWPMFGIFRIVPVFIRDIVYRWIALNRYRWFGKREVCRISMGDNRLFLPTMEEIKEIF